MSRLPLLLLLALAMLPLGILGTAPAAAEEAAAVEVPSLLGKSEADARALLEARGLLADVTYVEDGVAPAGTVISQDPKSGAEILAGATIQLRVVGPAPDADAPDAPADDGAADKVAVPALAGLSLKAAEDALLALGLTPRPDFVKSDEAEAFHVLAQDLAADTLVATGTHIRFQVALGAETPSTLLMPSLYGLSEADAIAVLDQLGLQGLVVRVVSNLPAGMVFKQSPAAGTEVTAGGAAKIQVAEKPPVDWTPPMALVPNLLGMSSDQAHIALIARGLLPRMKRGLKPNANVRKVFQQNRPAGSQLLVGSKVTFYLPYKALVPNLIGLKKGTALSKLSAAGLQGDANGPAVGIGTTKVISQNRPAGSTIARGSLVRFHFKYTATMGVVPNLIDLSPAAAKAKLVNAGFQDDFTGPAILGLKKIYWQFPAAGTPRLLGSTVKAKYKFAGNIVIPIKRTVPNLIGLSPAAAKAKLQSVQLKDDFSGPAILGLKKIHWQWPLAGTKVAVGSTVKAKYKFAGNIVIPIGKVTVPNLIGLSPAAAKAKLQNAQLKDDFSGPAILGLKKIHWQWPAAGTKLPKWSKVKAKYKFAGNIVIPLNKVKMPNVIGMNPAVAKALLQGKGFNVSFIPSIGSKVVYQSIPAGKMVLKGSAVKLRRGL